jgi:hypothetical protein
MCPLKDGQQTALVSVIGTQGGFVSVVISKYPEHKQNYCYAGLTKITEKEEGFQYLN